MITVRSSSGNERLDQRLLRRACCKALSALENTANKSSSVGSADREDSADTGSSVDPVDMLQVSPPAILESRACVRSAISSATGGFGAHICKGNASTSPAHAAGDGVAGAAREADGTTGADGGRADWHWPTEAPVRGNWEGRGVVVISSNVVIPASALLRFAPHQLQKRWSGMNLFPHEPQNAGKAICSVGTAAKEDFADKGSSVDPRTLR